MKIRPLLRAATVPHFCSLISTSLRAISLYVSTPTLARFETTVSPAAAAGSHPRCHKRIGFFLERPLLLTVAAISMWRKLRNNTM